jgi:hypothetical protein
MPSMQLTEGSVAADESVTLQDGNFSGGTVIPFITRVFNEATKRHESIYNWTVPVSELGLKLLDVKLKEYHKVVENKIGHKLIAIDPRVITELLIESGYIPIKRQWWGRHSVVPFKELEKLAIAGTNELAKLLYLHYSTKRESYYLKSTLDKQKMEDGELWRKLKKKAKDQPALTAIIQGIEEEALVGGG